MSPKKNIYRRPADDDQVYRISKTMSSKKNKKQQKEEVVDSKVKRTFDELANRVDIANLYEEWEQRASVLTDFMAEDGPLDLLTADLCGILEVCPREHFGHYVLEAVKIVYLVREEAWLLMNGLMLHKYQTTAYKKYQFFGLEHFADSHLNLTSRFVPGRPVSVLSHDGILYLHKKTLRVSFCSQCLFWSLNY